MDSEQNPYSPGAGSPPPVLVGRDGILTDARVLLARVRQKRSEKSMLLTGLRGVGKTVLLNEIEHMAEGAGYHTVSIEAREGESLGEILGPELKSLLFELDRIAGAGDKVKRSLAVLRSFLGTLKFTVHDVTMGLGIDPAVGIADSGNLEIDLPHLFRAIAEAAEDRNTAVAIFIDEIQYFSIKDIGALPVAMH